MYQRKKLLKRRRAAAAVAFAAMLGLVVAVPTFASASGAGDLLNQVGVSGGSGGSVGSGSSGTDTSRAGVPPTYTPPLHGTNPHGQGTNAVIDLTPGTDNPYSSDPTQSGEEVVVGNSRGDQNSDGTYSGNVTLLYLFGNPVVQVKSDPTNNGETQHGPLQPLQTQLLDAICQNSNGQACITLLKMDSTSNSNSSTNAFELLGVHLGGESGLNADVLTSNGNISSDGTCQTSHGDSSAAHVTAGGNPVVDALQGSTDSGACAGAAPTQSNSSTTLQLGGNDVPIPDAGCPAGTPNTVFDSLSPLLAIVCNADDTNGSQTSAPYGVREALALFALINGDVPVLKVTAGDAESHAVAPGAGGNPGGNPGTGGTAGAGGKGGNKGGNGGGNGGNAGGNGAGAGAGAGAAAGNAAAGNGQLAFTGADLLALGLVGGALILGGLALTATGRGHRQTV
jgi:hypothetical protein